MLIDDPDEVPPGATAFDIPGVALSDHEGDCSFETFLRSYDLADQALVEIGRRDIGTVDNLGKQRDRGIVDLVLIDERLERALVAAMGVFRARRVSIPSARGRPAFPSIAGRAASITPLSTESFGGCTSPTRRTAPSTSSISMRCATSIRSMA